MSKRMKHLYGAIMLPAVALITVALSLYAYAAFSGHTENIRNNFSIAEVRLSAEFDKGDTVNTAMKELASAVPTPMSTESNTSITAFKHYNEIPDLDSLYTLDVSSEDSNAAIYMWYDAGTMYWWSPANDVYLNSDSSYMFYHLESVESIDTSEWITSNVINMSYMFTGCYKLYDLDTEDWDTGNVENMTDIFDLCISLTEIDVSKWNTSSLVKVVEIFDSLPITSLDLSGWDISHITDMKGMFENCTALESINLSGWDTSNVTNMDAMFKNCESLEDLTSLNDWEISSVENMEEIFYGTGAYNNYVASGIY